MPLTLLLVGGLAAVTADGEGTEGLNATSAQRLAAMVDVAASMAVSSEQLVATCRSLASAGTGLAASPGGVCGAPAAEEDRAVLERPLSLLGEANAALRALLLRLRDELGLLFTTGNSEGLGRVLEDLEALPTTSAGGRGAQLQEAAEALPRWVSGCGAPGARARYRHFGALHQEVLRLEVELRELAGQIFALRDERARADGKLAGLEERLGRERSRRSGEEYELARYLGASLFRWELLRTKVAHHLAVAFTEARERALKEPYLTDASMKEAESGLGLLEERLTRAASTHKRLAERRTELGRKLRAFLKSLLLSCEAMLGEAPLEAAVSKRFQVLRSRHLGVHAQAAEELFRFLNGTFTLVLPQAVSWVHEVLAPYALIAKRGRHQQRGRHSRAAEEYVLPSTWKARPKVGRWWEWLEEEPGGSRRGPVAQAEFERRFAAAKRHFSVRVSAAEPVVMAYLFWLLLEDALGAGGMTGGGNPDPPLALPGPADLTAAASASAGAAANPAEDLLTL